MTEMTVEDLKRKLMRRASRAVVGGFRPPLDPLVSWFGQVNVALPGEDWPTSAGKPMMPLCQFNLTELPFRPDNLGDLALLTVFIDQEELPTHKDNGDGWLLRAYPTLDGLVAVEPPADRGYLKSLPIHWEAIERDYPCWDDVSSMPMLPEIDENYHDLFYNQSGTKLGGWPTLIQSSIYWVLD